MDMIYKDKSRSIEERVQDLLDRMTLEEKVAQVSCTMSNQPDVKEVIKDGIGTLSCLNSSMTGNIQKDRDELHEIQRYLVEETRLGIPALIHNEGIAGLQIPCATTFQQSMGMAATWEPELARKMGEAEQKQLLAFGMHALHSPLFDLGRDPRWGRISETYGEDPYLVAQMGTAFVQGIQKDDKVMATAKHFIGYGNAEGGRNGGELQMGERTLKDTFSWTFEAAIQDAGIMAVMNGYGILNNEPVATSKKLLTDLLREELGFTGPVVSDYGSIGRADARYRTSADQRQTAVQALKAGIDVEQPTNVCFKHLYDAVKEGEVEESYLNQAVERVLRVKFRLGLFENPYGEGNFEEETRKEEYKELSQEIAEKSIVLLKNEDQILPLGSNLKIALIGPSADSKVQMFGGYSSVGSAGSTSRDFDQTENDKFLTMAYQATITEFKDGLKQAGIDFEDEPSPEQKKIIMNMVKESLSRGDMEYSSAQDFLDKYYPACRTVRQVMEEKFGAENILYAPGCEIRDEIAGGIEKAVECAKQADIVVAVMGGLESMVDEKATCGENRDNIHTDLEENQLKLMEALFAAGKPVVTVLIDGRPLSVETVSQKSKALLHAWLPAERGAEAIVNVLAGEVNPGGKLPVTVVKEASQVPMYYNRLQLFTAPETWSEYIHDESNVPLYPFGYGLSYTSFEYSDFKVEKEVPADGSVHMSFCVKNTGERDGAEIAQIYIRDILSSVARPCMQLAAFAKVALKAGETRTVSVEINLSQLAFHNDVMELVVEPGEMEVFVGASSEDIRMKDRFQIVGETYAVKRRAHSAKVEVL
ncbi:MAG: glycoside hydrolase family 3 C-terminal domain-containing protein [Muribaculaceae bacterium]|nr:glycoside hydrolase family 3 C-terminal domain-containing protein [Muribaculaceae bacterium]